MSPADKPLRAHPSSIDPRAASCARHSIYLSVGYLSLLTLLEWLFYLTKPSFLSNLSEVEALSVLLIAPLPFLLVAILVAVLGFVCRSVGGPTRIAAVLFALPPAAFSVAAAILFIDNFTNTVLGFGIASIRSDARVVIGAVIALSLAWRIRRVHRTFVVIDWSRSHWSRLVSVAALGLSLGCLLAVLILRTPVAASYQIDTRAATSPPDVLLISGDGFEVADFDHYGHPLENTSLFRALGPTTVVFENNFVNANRTSETTSITLTGRYATSTGKHSESRFFSGGDAYRHLPAMLRPLGYRSMQLGAAHHVDATYWGLQDAFDIQNGTRIERSGMQRLSDSVGGRLNWEAHFARVLQVELLGRISHAFGGKKLDRPHLIVKQRMDFEAEQDLIEQVLDFVDSTPAPIFVQYHSMSVRNWSPTEDPGSRGDVLDSHVTQIIEALRNAGRFENSLIVVGSDHGVKYNVDRRLPFLVKFPSGVSLPDHRCNTQTLDIAPTVVDLLDLPIPSWMEGRSLFEERDCLEPIFSSQSGERRGLERGKGSQLLEGGITDLSMVVCNKVFNLDLATGALSWRWIADHSAPCSPEVLPNERQAANLMIGHLIERGYGPIPGAVERSSPL